MRNQLLLMSLSLCGLASGLSASYPQGTVPQEADRAKAQGIKAQGGDAARDAKQRGKAVDQKLDELEKAARDTEKKSPDKVVKRMLNEIKRHEVRAAKMSRLRAVFAERGDTDKVQQLDEMVTTENARHQHLLKAYRGELGDKAFAKVEAAVDSRRAARQAKTGRKNLDRKADRIKGDAKRGTDRVKGDAKRGADRVKGDAKRGTDRVKGDAKRGADRVKGDAKPGADRVKGDAKRKTDHVKGDAKPGADRVKGDAKRKTDRPKNDKKRDGDQRRKS